MIETVDHAIIGSGAYGTHIAASIAEAYPQDSIAILEETELPFSRASINNHGRLHWGYQYPIHPETAIQSRNNVELFIDDYGSCVIPNTIAYYGIHRNSAVTPQAYEQFCISGNLPYEVTSAKKDVFGDQVSTIFHTEELSFSTTALKEILLKRARDAGVQLLLSHSVESVTEFNGQLRLKSKHGDVLARQVFNCAYSAINKLHRASALPTIPSTHDAYALFTIELPEKLRGTSATVIYGPYASIVAQANGDHVLAHVTHSNYLRAKNFEPSKHISEDETSKRYRETIRDAYDYLPVLQDATRTGEKIEVKSVYGDNPSDGERRVQVWPHYGGLTNYNVVMGGKMNSFYDAGSFALTATVKARRHFTD